MNLNWSLIKENIYIDIHQRMMEGTPSYSETQIKHGIELFKNIVYHRVSLGKYNFLYKDLMLALQRAYVTDRTPYDSLTQIGTSLDVYVKKLALVLEKVKPEDIITKNLDFISLYRKLRINDIIQNSSLTPSLKEGDLEVLKGRHQYLYELARARVDRNKVHTSENTTSGQFADILTNFMIVFVFSALKFESDYSDIVIDVDLSKPILLETELDKSKDNAFLGYSYLTYSKDVQDLKQEYATSVVLYSLAEGDKRIEEIVELVNTTFSISNSDRMVNSIIGKFLTNKEAKKEGDLIVISKKLRKKAEQRVKDYRFNYNHYRKLIIDVLIGWGQTEHVDVVVDGLIELYTGSFTNAILEIKGKVTLLTPENSGYGLYNHFYNVLGVSENAKILVGELLDATEGNEYLTKISAGLSFKNLNISSELGNYSRQKKITFLDTPVLIHSMFYKYKVTNGFASRYHSTITDLCNLSKSDLSIDLFAPGPYITELGYRIKLALLLIPFSKRFKNFDSNNTFYTYYKFFKSHDDSLTFESMMYDILRLRETDAYRYDVKGFIFGQAVKALESANIKRAFLEEYPYQNDVYRLIDEITDKNPHLRGKSKQALKNDSWIILFLNDSQAHEVEPFFVTWDSAFKIYRKEFKDQFEREKPIIWHQYTPSSFINSINLSQLKIDPKTSHEQLLGMIEEEKLVNKTKTIFDSYVNFTEANSNENLRERINLVYQILENKFDQSVTDDYIPESDNNFDNNLAIINKYLYQDEVGKFTSDDYYGLYSDDDKFEKILEILSNKDNKGSVISEINSLILEDK
jgi:hypothetical protein